MKSWLPVILTAIAVAILTYIIRDTSNIYVLLGISFGALFVAMVSGGYYVSRRNAAMKLKAIQTQNIGKPIESPAGAVFRIEESTYDAGDPDEVLVATVHKVGDCSVGNTWIYRFAKWQKLMPDRVLKFEPSPDILAGEVLRLVRAYPVLNEDTHLKLAVMGLMTTATRMAS